MKKFLALLVIFIMIGAPLTAAAANPCSRQAVEGASKDHFTQFPKCISAIYTWSLGVAGLLALLVTTAGAFTYMTAAGNAEKAQKGTEMIWGAVIGLALLFGAYLLLNTINPNLVNFNLSRGTCIKNGQAIDYQQKGLCESAGGKWYEIGNNTPAPSLRN